MQITNANRTEAGPMGLRIGSVQRNSLWAVVIFIALLIIISPIAGGPAFASSDDLHLIGIVKTIDPRTGIIFVNVQSESCPGIRRFYADDLGAMGKYVNQTITFFIDSDTCRDTAIHTIKVSRGIKK